MREVKVRELIGTELKNEDAIILKGIISKNLKDKIVLDFEDTKLLLLSATPYKMYTLYQEDEIHYDDFIRTAQFLLTNKDDLENSRKNISLWVYIELIIKSKIRLDSALNCFFAIATTSVEYKEY